MYVSHGRRWIGDEYEAAVEMNTLALGRICDRCKGVCYTAAPRQRTKGRHPLCDPNAWTDVLTDDGERAVLKTLMAAFPGAVMTMKARPPR